MKIFLSIGSGEGMGRASAERFAKEGFAVVLSARSEDKVKKLAEQLGAKGYSADAVTVNAGDGSSVAALIDSVTKKYGGIDVLHYNAAAMRQASVVGQPIDTFNSDLAVNIGGALAAIHSAGPGMFEKGVGSILLTGGGFALFPSPDFISLSIGKAGIRALAQGLFEDFKVKGVHVATVTVAMNVTPQSEHPAAIAECFWQLHAQERGSWTWEGQYPKT
jgi:short-subunit dehydrogenase